MSMYIYESLRNEIKQWPILLKFVIKLRLDVAQSTCSIFHPYRDARLLPSN
jgi:hypothetical protein